MKARRDEPGPNHQPAVRTLKSIDGVVIAASPSVRYEDDNLLTELTRPGWTGVFKSGEAIEHLYTVKAPSGGIRKEWYFHEHTTDRYMVLSGHLDIGLFDGRESSPTFRGFEVLSLGEPGSQLPNMVRIPPRVWHSLSWMSTSGLFLNAKTPPYTPGLPDKFRVQPEDYPPEIIWNA